MEVIIYEERRKAESKRQQYMPTTINNSPFRAQDCSVLYLYNCDRIGHRDGFGLGTESYVVATREMIDERVSKIAKTVEAREARMNEDWLVIVCTDHGGTSRIDVEDCEGKFDVSDGGAAFGQGNCEGVHGLGSIKQVRLRQRA